MNPIVFSSQQRQNFIVNLKGYLYIYGILEREK